MYVHATVLTLAFALAGPARADGTASSALPLEPQRGGELALLYDPAAPDAALAGPSGIYGVVSFLSDSGSRTVSCELAPAPADDVLRASLTVPDDAVYAYVRFVSRTAWDRAADVELMVHGDDGAPVRGARLPRVYIQEGDYLSLVEEELRCYPDNYAAYRTKWFLSTVFCEREELLAMVDSDLRELGDARSAEALWALSYGLMLLGEEPLARPVVLEALERFPTAGATVRCVGDYDYQSYSQNIEEGRAEVNSALAKAVAEHPNTWLGRDNVRVLAYGAELTLETTRAVCEPWMRNDPLNPEPKLVLARKLLSSGGDLEEAARLVSLAVNAYLDGDARLAGDTAGSMTNMMLPSAFRTAAEIARARQDLGSALAYALASQRVQTRTGAKPHELEAGLWEELGDKERAAAAWNAALSQGSTTATEAIARLSAAGVEQAATRSNRELREPAAPFAIEDLDGVTVELSALRGSVVVLNFWGLGCAPCRREIPQLNELVRRFEGRPVEFIALAGDDSKDVRAYLEEHEFLYRQVARAGRVAGAYGVQGLPVHVVIDPEGLVAGTLYGAGEDQDDVLSVLIEGALNEAD